MSLDASLDPSLSSVQNSAISSRAPSAIATFAVAALGVAWNTFGVVQFLQTLRSTPDSLAQMGMTPEQAAVYSSYPAWMNVAFAVGTFAGLLGSVLLLLRRRVAVPVFAASLAGYVVLFVGDVTEGVFAALGASQVAILTTVVAVAAGLLIFSRRLLRRGALT